MVYSFHYTSIRNKKSNQANTPLLLCKAFLRFAMGWLRQRLLRFTMTKILPLNKPAITSFHLSCPEH